jgi:3-phenylpropionate/trans-cinnamate dioxygenase ferredoxin subunit
MCRPGLPLPQEARRVPEFVRVARLSDIPPGTMKGVKARGKEILIVNVDGEAYAVGDRCTHLRYRLHKGAKLEGTVIECHGHGTRYDVTDGGLCRWVTKPPSVRGANVADAGLRAGQSAFVSDAGRRGRHLRRGLTRRRRCLLLLDFPSPKLSSATFRRSARRPRCATG